MRKGLTRMVTAVAVGSVLAVSGAGMASADTTGSSSGGGSGSVTTSPETSADAIQKLRDRLAVKADNGEYKATQRTASEVKEVLSSLKKRSAPWAARSEVRSRTVSSLDLAVRFGNDLKTYIEVRQGLPDPSSILKKVNQLLQSLLTTLSGLLDGLLGGGAPPVPIPEPELPPAPVPGR